MNTPDLLAAIGPVVDVFDRLSVSYSVVGSIASSAHGIARATLDADLVADLHPPEDTPGAREFSVDTPEDTVLHKLEWFKAGGEVSERQWGDIVGVIRVQGDALDADYLRTWAHQLGVGDLLARAFREAETA